MAIVNRGRLVFGCGGGAFNVGVDDRRPHVRGRVQVVDRAETRRDNRARQHHDGRVLQGHHGAIVARMARLWSRPAHHGCRS
jgi:hypothetical protein